MAHDPSGPLGHAERPVHVQVRESRLTWMTLFFTLVTSFLALVVSLVTLWFTWSPRGEVRAIEPSSYAIIRQDTLGPGPGYTATAEHLVLPVEWKNDKGSPVLIRRLELTVREPEGNGETHKFHLIKEYPLLSGQTFKEEYDFRNSLTLEPHSVATRVLSFRSEDFDFQFAPYTEYEVTLRFLLYQPSQPLVLQKQWPYFLVGQDSRITREERPGPDELGWRFCTYDSFTADMVHTGPVQWNWWRFDEAHNGSCRA